MRINMPSINTHLLFRLKIFSGSTTNNTTNNPGRPSPRLLPLLFSAGLLLLYIFFLSRPAAGADLILSGGQAEKGRTVTLALAVNNAPNTVEAFRLDIEYDFTILRFSNSTAGELSRRGYELFKAFNQAPGVVRVGGVAPENPGIQKGSSGVLVLVTFEVRKNADCDLALTGLENDIKNWRTLSGRFQAIAGTSSSEKDTGGDSGGTSEKNLSLNPDTAKDNDDKANPAEAEIGLAEESGTGNDPALTTESETSANNINKQPALSRQNPAAADGGTSFRRAHANFSRQTRRKHIDPQSKQPGSGFPQAGQAADNPPETAGEPSLPAAAWAKQAATKGKGKASRSPVSERKTVTAEEADNPQILPAVLPAENGASENFFWRAAEVILQAAVLIVLLLIFKEMKASNKMKESNKKEA